MCVCVDVRRTMTHDSSGAYRGACRWCFTKSDSGSLAEKLGSRSSDSEKNREPEETSLVALLESFRKRVLNSFLKVCFVLFLFQDFQANHLFVLRGNNGGNKNTNSE